VVFEHSILVIVLLCYPGTKNRLPIKTVLTLLVHGSNLPCRYQEKTETHKRIVLLILIEKSGQKIKTFLIKILDTVCSLQGLGQERESLWEITYELLRLSFQLVS